MGNSSSSGSSSSQKSVSVSNKSSNSYTDSRAYSNIDAKSYTNIDDKSYTNIDSRDMSTNISTTDNRSVSNIALDCGVKANDVENYENNESINMNQNNSQNIVVSGDGNTLENISQSMNLTSYGPEVKKCLQDAINQQESKNTSKIAFASKNVVASKTVSKNTSESKTTTESKQESQNTTDQTLKTIQSTSQTNDQKSSTDQTGGMASGGSDILIIIIILAIVSYMLYPELFNKFKLMENCALKTVLGIFFFIIFLKK